MNKDRNALKAGLFVVGSFIAAVVVVLLIRGEGTGAIQVRTVTFKLSDDVSGLNAGDDVRLGGTKVGTVRAIQIETRQPPAKLIVTFSIPAEFILHEDAEVAIQSSLTGPSNLNIGNLGVGKPLPESTALAGLPDAKAEFTSALRSIAPRLEAIAADLQRKTVPKLNDAIDSANTLVKHVNTKVDPVVKQYDGVATNASGALAEVRDLVGESKTDFRGTVKNLNQATASVREKLPPLIEKVTGIVDKVDGALTSARAALEDVQKTAANAREISASARSIVVDNRARLDTLVKSLKTTSDNLKATSVEVRHSPWRLLYKPSPEEMGNLNLYDSARQFAEGAAALSDSASALRDAMHDPNVDKAQLQKLLDHLDQSFKSFHLTENKLWTAVKE